MIDRFEGKNRFLSNFYWHDGWCVEIPFQAAKATNEKDRQYVLAAKSAREAKKRGHEIKCREDWEAGHKEEVMRLLLMKKFENPELRRKLMDTGHQDLIEGNWWHDNEWGDCYCIKCRKISGHNKLGMLLTEVRQEIAETEMLKQRKQK